MSLSTSSHPGTAPLRADRTAALWISASRWLIPAAAGVLAFLLRALGLSRSNDLFIDELTYARLASTVSNGELPNLAGQPFLLHPPADFILNGLVIKLLGLSTGTMDLVYQLRWVNAVLGAVLVVLAFLIMLRLTGPRVATVATAVVTFDPFILRNDSRVMLETPTAVALLAGWLVLIVARTTSPQRPWLWSAGGGLLLGIAIITKDMAMVPALLPLALAALWRRTLPRRQIAVVAAATLLPYAIYLVVLAATGLLAQWWAATTFGVSRMIGTTQITGFNAPGAPSLMSRLVDQAGAFATSYVLIAVCVIAGLIAAFSASAARRLVGLIAISTGILGLYAASVGTLEEQFGYYVVVTSVLALAVTTTELIERHANWRRPVTITALVFLAATVAFGVKARIVSDNGYQQARAWMDNHISSQATVGLTSVTAEFALLPHAHYGVWPSLTSLDAHRAQYVLTQERPLSEGYGYASPQLLSWLKTYATPVFDASGPSGGHTVVWQLDPNQVNAAVASGTALPPVNGNYQ